MEKKHEQLRDPLQDSMIERDSLEVIFEGERFSETCVSGGYHSSLASFDWLSTSSGTSWLMDY